jgi:hypothetical protein
MGCDQIRKFILCECGEFIEGETFKDYIKTSSNPSTPTFGHAKCGFIFDFIDSEMPKRYSSRKELKNLALKFAEKNKMDNETTERLLLEVDRLKSLGKMSDAEILKGASKNLTRKGLSFRGEIISF